LIEELVKKYQDQINEKTKIIINKDKEEKFDEMKKKMK
jgi:hypothetical protein